MQNNKQYRSYRIQRRLLQIIICTLLIVPLGFGLIGIIFGIEGFNWLFQIASSAGVERNLDSDFRFLAGVFFGFGFLVLWILPRIEKETALFRFIALMIFLGGIGRLIGIFRYGLPNTLTVLLLLIELLFPLLAVWQAHIAKYRFDAD